MCVCIRDVSVLTVSCYTVSWTRVYKRPIFFIRIDDLCHLSAFPLFLVPAFNPKSPLSHDAAPLVSAFCVCVSGFLGHILCGVV